MSQPPLVSPEVDLRDFAFMPLDVTRLRDSDLSAIATGDGFRAAVILWCVAWHQVPAASLPNDDRVLASFAGYARSPDAWASIRSEALHGFVECDDGRLYHATIAEKALEGWIEKLGQRKSSAAGNARRYGQTFDPAPIDAAIRDALGRLLILNPSSRLFGKRLPAVSQPTPVGGPDPIPLPSQPTPVGSPGPIPLPSQETIKGQVREESPSPPTARSPREDGGRERFDRFWEAMPGPDPAARAEALGEFLKLAETDQEAAISGAFGYAEEWRRKPTPHPRSPVAFLQKRGFEGFKVLAPSGTAKVRVDQDTPQGDAWDAYRRARGEKCVWSSGRWYFDTEWPPGQAQGPPKRLTLVRAS